MRWVFVLLLVSLLGCPAFETQTITNYKLGEVRYANPGEAMISVETSEQVAGASALSASETERTRRELVYTGHNGAVVFLLYREYVNGLIRDGFRQELTYDLTQNPELQFGPWQVQIIAATNAGVEFIVLTDRGLSTAKPVRKK